MCCNVSVETYSLSNKVSISTSTMVTKNYHPCFFCVCAFAGIEDLCNKRDELNKYILEEEEEKKKIQGDVKILTERLARVNESLSKRMASRNEFDKTIAETEAAYMKVRMH